MGNNLCGCSNSTELQNKKTIETNLSKYSNQYLNNEEETTRTQLTYRELRTKAGTRWEEIEGIEKIVILYNVNLIIRHFRKYLKAKKANPSVSISIDNSYYNNN